jgi:hypothetical protein
MLKPFLLLAHMPYAKQSFYKELIHYISKTVHGKKTITIVVLTNCCVILHNITLRTI